MYHPSKLVLVSVGSSAWVVMAMCLMFNTTHGQAHLSISDNAWLRIENGAWVVVENGTPAGIQTLGSGGNIRSEGEFNRVRWLIRDNSGSFVVPFTAASGVKMPLTYSVIAPGSNAESASICFSTFNHASSGVPLVDAWNNDFYRPSDVTHMNSYNAPSVPNSEFAVDRFWIIDPGVPGYAYVSLPSIALTFVYDPSAVPGEVTTGNAIGPADPIGAQRFNSSAGLWGDYLPAGTWTAGTPSIVVGALAGPSDFFRSWTLASYLEPLPVELLGFRGECDGRSVLLQWSTASEVGSSHFLVERSVDGTLFSALARVEAAGTSYSVQQYDWRDEAPLHHGYYRLKQVDRDGSSKYGSVVALACSGERGVLHAWDDGRQLNVMFNAPTEGVARVVVLDAAGRQVLDREYTLPKGDSQFQLPHVQLSSGIYVLVVQMNAGVDVLRVNVYR